MNKLRIVQDSSPESPREWDNLGTIAYKHSSYTLGEEEIDEPIEWLESMLGINNAYIYSNERLRQLEERFFNDYIALPLYLYDHSGISLSTSSFSCRWDSGKVGYIYISKDKVREEYGVKRINDKLKERVLSVLENEIKTFDMYVSGEVYGFEILDEDGEVVDSCYGFFGDNHAESGMLEHIDSELLGLTESELEEFIQTLDVEYSY